MIALGADISKCGEYQLNGVLNCNIKKILLSKKSKFNCAIVLNMGSLSERVLKIKFQRKFKGLVFGFNQRPVEINATLPSKNANYLNLNNGAINLSSFRSGDDTSVSFMKPKKCL